MTEGPFILFNPAQVTDTRLSDEEIRRYARHVVIPEMGAEGQKRLKLASVLVIGAGGLGSPVLLYLAAAGIGRMGLVEPDIVDDSNLQRQVIYDTGQLGRPKALSAAGRIRTLNPFTKVEVFQELFTEDNAGRLVRKYDLVIDATDNFQSRYLSNDTCVRLGRPNIFGSVSRFEGMASVFWAPHGPCYRCLNPEPPPPGAIASCAEAGVLGVVPGVIGAIQAAEAVKLIIGQGDPLIGRLLLFNALTMTFRETRIRRDPECPVCARP